MTGGACTMLKIFVYDLNTGFGSHRLKGQCDGDEH